jgi:hypothetical protein
MQRARAVKVAHGADAGARSESLPTAACGGWLHGAFAVAGTRRETGTRHARDSQNC